MRELLITPNKPCCRPSPKTGQGLPGYRIWPFVQDWLATPSTMAPMVKDRWEGPDYLGWAGVRLGIGRGRYRVAPGLYALGRPGPESPVLATANFKLTFDVLRRDTRGLDAWLLVLDTKGVNVWCAAGKGTFNAGELIRRIKEAGLDGLVSHRRVIAPQLCGPGLVAREVKEATGFRVVFGPVRAKDIKEFLQAGMKATPQMRRVDFPALDRLMLGLVEFALALKTMALVWAGLFLLAGLGQGIFSPTRAWNGAWLGFAAYMLGFAAGNLLTPLGLPWWPGRAFSLKGATVGALTGLFGWALAPSAWCGLGLWLGAVAVGSWYAMNFTGSSTYTSASGVEKEMRRAMPWQVAGLLAALAAWRAGLGG